MTDRKLFGTTTLVNEFIQKLTKTETAVDGWATKYIDKRTRKEWLKYVADDRTFFENLMLISPEPTTGELIAIAFSPEHPDEVSAAAIRLNIEERTEKKEYRQKLMNRLHTMDFAKASQ